MQRSSIKAKSELKKRANISICIYTAAKPMKETTRTSMMPFFWAPKELVMDSMLLINHPYKSLLKRETFALSAALYQTLCLVMF
jgi:hypothetical protein